MASEESERNDNSGVNESNVDTSSTGNSSIQESERSAFQNASQTALGHLVLAKTLYRNGRYSLALDELDKTLKLNPELSTAYFIRGLVSIKRADLRDARESLATAVRLQNDLFQAWMALAHVERELGDLDGALTAVTSALRVDPQNAAAHLSHGSVLQASGDLNAATSAYEEAVRLNPTSKFAHYRLGCVLVELGKLDQAEQQILMAHRLHPLDRASQIALGDLHLSRGEHEKAIRDFKAAVDLDLGKSALPQGKLGEAYFLAGFYQEASVALRNAIRRDPKQIESILLLGQLYLQTGNVDEATSLFENAVELDGRYPKAERLLKEAQALSNQ